MGCSHLALAKDPPARAPAECEECLASGGRWVELRLCRICGHVGCCDSSPGQHATKHFHSTRHPLIRSLQPGATWTWCYLDEQMVA
jgi:uncharacterized UBP type Zn finger protein